MATIVESLTGEKALSLGREEFIRKLNFGSNWTQLRVALWCSVPYTSTITNAIVMLGVCQGTANGYRSALPDDAVTVSFGLNAANWTYSAGPPQRFNVGSSGIAIRQYVGATYKADSVSNSTAAVSAESGRPFMLAIDFIRLASDSTRLRWSGYSPVSTGVTTADIAYGFDRYRAADWQRSWSSGVIEVPYVSSPGSQFQTFDANGNGKWDSVTVNWTHNTPQLEIYNLIVVRFSA